MQKLTKKIVNAIAHNLIVGEAITHAWDFVTSMQVHNEFDYAFINSAADDYCDTCWHTTQNVKLGQSMDLIDQNDMAQTALSNFLYAFEDVNIAEITVEDVYKALDQISGDTAMRENYYMQLQQHFKNFVDQNTNFAFKREGEYEAYKLVSKHTAKQKEKMVREYLEKYDAYDHIELNNDLAW